MKPINLLMALCLCLILTNCDSDNETDNTPVSDNPGLEATINGGTYSNFNFVDTIYDITASNASNTMRIDAGSANGDQITLFMNSTGGFENGVTKEINNTDQSNFRTYVLIRQFDTQISYYASSGSITINTHRPHPEKEGFQLITGVFNVSAATQDQTQTTQMSGTFTDLEYQP